MRGIIACSSEGLGHSSRALALYEGFSKQGDEILLLTYGKAYERFRRLGLPVIETKREAVMRGKNGTFDFPQSALFTSINFPEILLAFAHERKIIKKYQPSFILSDCHFTTTLLGAELDIPTFYMTNQTTFHPINPNTKEYRMMERLRVVIEKEIGKGALVGRLVNIPATIPLRYADEILIPDFSPPDTISLPILSRDYDIRKKSYFVGVVNPLLERHRGKEREEWDVIVNLGGQEFRHDVVATITRLFSKSGLRVGVTGTREKRTENGVELFGFVDDPYPYLSRARVLVISGGHSSIMETILLEKPAVVVPDVHQQEQEENAQRYAELGLGIVGQWHTVHEQIAKLFRQEETIRERLKTFKRRAYGQEHGVKNTITRVHQYVQRISY